MGLTASMDPQLLEDMGAVVTSILYTETTCSVSHSCQVVRSDVSAASALAATEAREAPWPPHKAPSVEGSCQAFPGPRLYHKVGRPLPSENQVAGPGGGGRGRGAGRDPRSPDPHILHVKILEGSGPRNQEKRKVNPEPKLAECTA